MISAFDIFKIGIGPSSSHTMGPMWAAYHFQNKLKDSGHLGAIQNVTVNLYGSLALTGKGHDTDKAVILGLLGERPDTVNPLVASSQVAACREQSQLKLAGEHTIRYNENDDLIFNASTFLPFHPNGIRFQAFDNHRNTLLDETYFSVGGGFVVSESEGELQENHKENLKVTYPFSSGEDLLEIGKRHNLSLAEIMLANERTWRPEDDTNKGLDLIWQVMNDSIHQGCHTEGTLPGGLDVKRRAKSLHDKLQGNAFPMDPLAMLDWVSMFALAVNEENAAGGRIVTAPTNGAAGVIPAVMAYYRRFFPGADDTGCRTFLLTSAAIGILYKLNASFSAAEMGCQGEVGVACSMAAGGLAAVMGGNNEQIENAAEIGMEHNLGLTCDPVNGLVQVPCIERNTMGATKAINAARLAVLHGDGLHRVSLDKVIETMRQTGVDMQAKYKETSLGGLAVNVINC